MSRTVVSKKDIPEEASKEKKGQYRSPEALKNKRAYDKEYNKKYFKQKTIVFNTQYPDDYALLEWVKVQPEGGNAYIKRLIREDIEKRRNQ